VRSSIGIIVFLDPPFPLPTQWVGQVKCAHTNHVLGQRAEVRKCTDEMRTMHESQCPARTVGQMPRSILRDAALRPVCEDLGCWNARFPGPRIDHPRIRVRRCRLLLDHTIRPGGPRFISRYFRQVNGNFIVSFSMLLLNARSSFSISSLDIGNFFIFSKNSTQKERCCQKI